MKILLALLVITTGVGAAYWKVQHPNATIDDVKTGAMGTLERAKTGFAAFRDSNGASVDAASVAAAEQRDLVDQRLGGLESSMNDRLSAIESASSSFDGAGIEGRIDAVDVQISQINDSMGAFAEEIDTISSSLGNLNDNVASAANDEQNAVAQITAINERVDSLASALEEQDAEQTLTNIGTRIDSIDTRLSELAQGNTETLNDINAKVTQVTDQSTALEARINTLSVDASAGGDESGNLRAQVDQRLQEIETKLATTNSDAVRVNSLMERLNTTDEQLSSLSAAQSGSGDTTRQIDELMKIIESNAEKTAALETQLNEANDQLASLSEELTVLQSTGSSASVESLQADLNGQLEQLESRIENANDNTDNGDINNLNQALATTRNRIQQLEQRVQSLPTDGESAQTAQAAQNALQEQIAAMETRLRSLPQQTDPELVNTLNQVQADVAELRDRTAANDIEYKVYFDPGSIQISDEAGTVLKSFIRQEQNRTTGVNIYGFTDRKGDASYNQRLALQRATSVRSFLIQNGFDFTKIKSLSGLGEDAAARTLDDGAEDADQRTVVLVANQP